MTQNWDLKVKKYFKKICGIFKVEKVEKISKRKLKKVSFVNFFLITRKFFCGLKEFEKKSLQFHQVTQHDSFHLRWVKLIRLKKISDKKKFHIFYFHREKFYFFSFLNRVLPDVEIPFAAMVSRLSKILQTYQHINFTFSTFFSLHFLTSFCCWQF